MKKDILNMTSLVLFLAIIAYSELSMIGRVEALPCKWDRDCKSLTCAHMVRWPGYPVCVNGNCECRDVSVPASRAHVKSVGVEQDHHPNYPPISD